jgi:arylsulfatase
MNNLNLIGFYLILLVFLSFGCKPEKQSPPNIVIIFIDDMGYADVGCFGATDYKTPNIDQLATEGMMFTNFYASQAVCSASRASLLTGCYAERVGISGALMPWSNIGLNSEETTIAEMLKKNNYATAIFGKWHLGHQKQFLPLQHGFDEYTGLPYSNDMWPVDYDGTPLNNSKKHKSNYPPLPLFDGNEIIDTIAKLEDQARLTTLYTNKAVQFIQNHKNEAFFLYMPHSMVHVPIAVSDKFKGKSGKGLFADVMMELDWSVGEIIKTLEENDLDKNTLIIFTSDNGPWLNFGNHAGFAYPLREGKGTMWEGGPRVSTIMKWPGKIKAGSKCNQIASTIDILPTLSEITGTALPKHKIDGVSILPLLKSKKDANPRNVFYYYYGKRLIAVRKDKWKLVFPHTGRSYKDMKPGKDGYPGPTRTFTVKEPELYNLETDISETIDLSSQYPKVVEELKRIGDSARNDLGDKIRNIKGKGVRKAGRIKQEKMKVDNLAKGKKIKIKGNAGIEYSAQGDKTLTNGILGSFDFTDGEWLGFQGQDIEINIDLEGTISLKQIDCRFLENQRAWIFSPESLEVSLSKNGVDFKSVKVYEINAEKQQEKETIKEFKVMLDSQKARYIKISVKSIGELPKWYPGAGGKAWVFVDEIVVK